MAHVTNSTSRVFRSTAIAVVCESARDRAVQRIQIATGPFDACPTRDNSQSRHLEIVVVLRVSVFRGEYGSPFMSLIWAPSNIRTTAESSRTLIIMSATLSPLTSAVAIAGWSAYQEQAGPFPSSRGAPRLSVTHRAVTDAGADAGTTRNICRPLKSSKPNANGSKNAARNSVHHVGREPTPFNVGGRVTCLTRARPRATRLLGWFGSVPSATSRNPVGISVRVTPRIRTTATPHKARGCDDGREGGLVPRDASMLRGVSLSGRAP